MAVAFAITWST